MQLLPTNLVMVQLLYRNPLSIIHGAPPLLLSSQTYSFHSLVRAGLSHLSGHLHHLLTLLGDQFGSHDQVLLGAHLTSFSSMGEQVCMYVNIHTRF